MFFLLFCLMREGSGSGSLTNRSRSVRPKYMDSTDSDPDPQHCLSVIGLLPLLPLEVHCFMENFPAALRILIRIHWIRSWVQVASWIRIRNSELQILIRRDV
jgi:hypothetical protein